MNILHIRPYIELGGVAKYMIRLCEGLNRRGHHVFVASAGGELGQKITPFAQYYDSVALSPSNLQNFVRAANQLRQIVQREQIDIINTHHRFAALIGKAVARLTNTPYVSTMHEIRDNRSLLTRIGLGDQIITLSPAVKQHIVNDYYIQTEKVHVIPMGIEISSSLSLHECSILAQQFGLSEGAPVIGCIGRLSEEKGQIYLLQAIPDILQIYPTAQFLFVGEGAERTHLEAETSRLGISSNVFFLGWQDNISSIIDLCTFVVLPSVTEGFGIVLLEAFAQKKAIIATAVDNIPELIKPEQTGLLVPSRDSQALSAAIVQLLQNPALTDKLGENGYNFVISNHSSQNFIVQTEQIYLNLNKK